MKPKRIWKEADRRQRASKRVKDTWEEVQAIKDKQAIVSLFGVRRKGNAR